MTFYWRCPENGVTETKNHVTTFHSSPSKFIGFLYFSLADFTRNNFSNWLEGRGLIDTPGEGGGADWIRVDVEKMHVLLHSDWKQPIPQDQIPNTALKNLLQGWQFESVGSSLLRSTIHVISMFQDNFEKQLKIFWRSTRTDGAIGVVGAMSCGRTNLMESHARWTVVTLLHESENTDPNYKIQYIKSTAGTGQNGFCQRDAHSRTRRLTKRCASFKRSDWWCGDWHWNMAKWRSSERYSLLVPAKKNSIQGEKD